MNKKIAMNYLFLCVSLISILITGIFFYENNDQENGYLLKEYKGQLAVFIYGNDTPEEIVSADINTFPPKDRQKLQEGIKASTKTELYRLIEDFSG